MHRHPDRPAWIVAEELTLDDATSTGSQIVFRYDAVTAMRDYDDGTLMVWLGSSEAGFLVEGTVAELFNMNIVHYGSGDFGQRGQQPVATTPMPAIAQSAAPAAPPSAPTNAITTKENT